MQQALGYADTLVIPLVFSSNGDAFLFHDKTVNDGALLNQRVAAIKAFGHSSNLDYAYLFLNSDFVLRGYQAELDSEGQQPNLKSSHVTCLRYPLPPLAEQAAIS